MLDDFAIPTTTGILGRTANKFEVAPDEKRWRIRKVFFTCVHPPEHEPSPSLVAEIRSFLPRFVPVWCVQEWIRPDGVEVAYGFHVLCQWTDIAEDPSAARPIKVENFPRDFPFRGGYIYELRTWGTTFHPEEPWLFYPFNQNTVEWLRATWNFLNAPGTLQQKYYERAEAAETAQMVELEKLDAEAKYKLNNDRVQIMDCLENGRIWAPPEGTRPSVEFKYVPQQGDDALLISPAPSAGKGEL